MERITLVQYLTALQGALRATVALCALSLILLCANKRSHIPAFKYLQSFILVMGIWGFFSSVFFFYPDTKILPYVSPLIYASISFGGPTFMLFCFSYIMPHREALIKSLHWIFLYPCVFSLFVLVPPLQKYAIVFTDELIYIPYRDILEHYNLMFYAHVICGYLTVLVGITVLAYKSIKHPTETTRGSRLAIVAALLYIGQNMVVSFGEKNNIFFWVPSITVLTCMILLFLTLYYDTAEQIIFKGRSAFLETMPFPVLIFNNNNVMFYSNGKGKELLGSIDSSIALYQKKQDILRHFTVFEFDADLPEGYQGESTKFIYQKNSNTLFFLQEYAIKDDRQIKNRSQLMMLFPLTSMQNFFSILEDKAFRDSLCNCYNGHFLRLKQREPIAQDLFPVSLLMCDIDNLKLINDILGHNKGDEYILACHNAIRACVRKENLIFRLGGDEFLVILLNTPAKVAHSIAKNIESLIQKQEGFEPHRIGISVGASTAVSVNESFEDCLQRADEAMYQMKAHHKEGA